MPMERRTAAQIAAEAEEEERELLSLFNLQKAQANMIADLRRDRIISVGVVALILLLLAIFGIDYFSEKNTQHQLARQQDQIVQIIEEGRAKDAERRLIACNESNLDREALNNVLLEATNINPETLEFGERFLALSRDRQEAIIEILRRRMRPIRDCSDEGIEAYFEGTGGQVPPEIPELPPQE